MMKLVENFLSIQGEGAFSGKLAYFVRFAGCNFNCTGFNVSKNKNGKTLIGCDTLRAVYTNEFKDEYKEFNSCIFEDILSNFKQKPMVVITGGEPLIHQEEPEFIRFMKYLDENNFLVQFETNASIVLKDYDFYRNFHFAMGIKLANSGVSKQKRINHKAIESILNLSKSAFFKIVLSKNDLENPQELMELKSVYKNADFYLMPQGATKKELVINAKSVIEYAINNGFNYTDRLHIRIYDDLEGV